MSSPKSSKDYSPGEEANDEEGCVGNDFLCGGEDSSSEDWDNPRPKEARRDNQGYSNARVQELKKGQNFSSVELKPCKYFDQNDPNVHQTTEDERKLFTDAVLFVASLEESESVINKNVFPSTNFNYHVGPDGDQGIDPLMNEDNSIILVNSRSLQNEEKDVFKTNADDIKAQIEFFEEDQYDLPVKQGSEQQRSVDDNLNEAKGGRRECGRMRYSYEETTDFRDTSLKGCNGEFHDRLKKFEQNQRIQTRSKKQNLKKIWKQFDLVQSKSDKVIERLLGKVDMVEHAIENSYKLYDAEFFNLRRRVEQLEAENGILTERLKISNMLSFIRDNTRPISSEHSREVLDHRNVNFSCISQSSQQKVNSEEFSCDDATVIQLEGMDDEDDNRPSTALKLASKLPKTRVKKEQEKDQGTDSSDDSQEDENHRSEDNRERSGQASKPFAKLKNKLKMGKMFLQHEDKKEDSKQEDSEKRDYEPEDRKHEGRKHENRKREGHKHENSDHQGRKYEDRKHGGRKHENSDHEGRKHEDRKHGGRKHENSEHEDRKHEDHKHEDRKNVNRKHEVCNHKNCKQENCKRKNENQCSGHDEVDANSKEKPKSNYLVLTRAGLLKNWTLPLNGSSLQ